MKVNTRSRPHKSTFTAKAGIPSTLTREQTEAMLGILEGIGIADVVTNGIFGDGDPEITPDGLFDIPKFVRKVAAFVVDAIVALSKKGVNITKDVFWMLVRFFSGYKNNHSTIGDKINQVINKEPELFSTSSSRTYSCKSYIESVKVHGKHSYVLTAYDEYESLIYMDMLTARKAAVTRSIMQYFYAIGVSFVAAVLLDIVTKAIKNWLLLSNHKF
jgi:hypothetical protein